jgi:hypothetical protein
MENKYIEGGHQCFMLGGGDPSIPNDIPSDVVFRYNTCYKPLRWKVRIRIPDSSVRSRRRLKPRTHVESYTSTQAD